MVLEILISTINRRDFFFLKQMFHNDTYKDYQILIINQTTPNSLLKSNFKNIRVINSFEKGISKSRNLAFRNAKGDVCLISDDDVEYVNDFKKIIEAAYREFDDADCIVFKSEIFNKKSNPKYLNYSKKINNIKELEHVSSVEITFKRKFVYENNIIFNEFLGINSFFGAGEEWPFLNGIMRLGDIYFKNKIVLKHDSLSTGSKINIDAMVSSKAVQYHILYPNLFHYYLIKLIVHLLIYNRINLFESFSFFAKGINAKKNYMKLKKEEFS